MSVDLDFWWCLTQVSKSDFPLINFREEYISKTLVPYYGAEETIKQLLNSFANIVLHVSLNYILNNQWHEQKMKL